MIVSLSSSPVGGRIPMPSSKSSMQRGCAAALLHAGTTVLEHCGTSNDEQAAIRIISALGARVQRLGDEITVHADDGLFHGPADKKLQINCGESGLSMRMFGPIASLFDFEVAFTGEGSILNRPMDFFDETLPGLGVTVNSNKGKLPVHFKGPLIPADITIDGSFSSQFLTGLLFAYARACTVPVSITVINLQSKPYIDLTLDVLRKFGYRVEHENYEVFHVLPRIKTLDQTIRYTVEGDWSNAAFLLVAGAIGGSVTLLNADVSSPQGDKKILEPLRDCGARVVVDGHSVTVGKNELKSFGFDATHCPDLFPPLVALAVNCSGVTTIKGVHRLLHKESNRAVTLQDVFTKLNADISFEDDVMTIHGGRTLTGGLVSSHNDHRIAMAAALAALTCKGEVQIEKAEAVNKSYPEFYEDLEKIRINH